MTIRPIAFTGAMVSALLDGRKTQTRRVLKSVPLKGAEHDARWNPHALRPSGSCPDAWTFWDGPSHGPSLYHSERIRFEIGDLLYVRECWRVAADLDELAPRDLLPCVSVRFEAAQSLNAGGLPITCPGRLRAAMHMPRWASRLTLKVTDVRVERVKQISEADAKAEGLEWYDDDDRPDRDSGYVLYPRKGPPGAIGVTSRDARVAFNYLWDSINAPRGFGWDANPWVVAISFELIRANVDQLPGPPAQDTQRSEASHQWRPS